MQHSWNLWIQHFRKWLRQLCGQDHLLARGQEGISRRSGGPFTNIRVMDDTASESNPIGFVHDGGRKKELAPVQYCRIIPEHADVAPGVTLEQPACATEIYQARPQTLSQASDFEADNRNIKAF